MCIGSDTESGTASMHRLRYRTSPGMWYCTYASVAVTWVVLHICISSDTVCGTGGYRSVAVPYVVLIPMNQ